MDLNGTRKKGLRQNGPLENKLSGKEVLGKMSLKKLFVKRMLGNLNDLFIFIDDSITHTKRFLTFTSRSYMHQTVEH